MRPVPKQYWDAPSEHKTPRSQRSHLERHQKGCHWTWKRPLEAPDGKSSEVLSVFLSSLRPAMTGKEDQWAWNPVNLGFLHEFCLLCPPPWASLKDVVSEVSLSVNRRQLYLPCGALNGISGGNIKDLGLPVHCCSVVSYSCDPMDCGTPGSSVPGDSPGKNTGVGCHALLQGIFSTQGLNPGLQHCRLILCPLSHQGSPTYCLVRNKNSVNDHNKHRRNLCKRPAGCNSTKLSGFYRGLKLKKTTARPRPTRGLGARPEEDLEGKCKANREGQRPEEQTKLTSCYLDLLLKAQAPGLLSLKTI